MGQALEPSAFDSELASQSSRQLASIIPTLGNSADINIEKEAEPIKIPVMALHLLMDILEEMSKGNPVSIIPTHAILTTQQAADILNVSRPYINKLIKEDKLAYHMVGSHRRIRYDDLKNYERGVDQKRQEVLKKLTALSQKEDMGY